MTVALISRAVSSGDSETRVQMPMYQKILVPLDGSELAECVLPHVETIARGCGVKEVIFLRVVEPFTMPARGEATFSSADIERFDAEHRSEAESYLNSVASRTAYGNNVKIRTEVVAGKPAESIADYATKSGMDLIVIATHGRSGISRWVFGSVADRLLRSSSVPVLMVRAPGCIPGHLV